MSQTNIKKFNLSHNTGNGVQNDHIVCEERGPRGILVYFFMRVKIALFGEQIGSCSNLKMCMAF